MRFGTALWSRSSLADAGLILAVPVLLLAVFALPESLRSGLVLEYRSPDLLTVYTSHFVHRSAGHLWANVLGYAFVVPVTYVLCVMSGRRGLFRTVFLGLLVALPFALSALNLLFVRPRVGYGFSGVVMGYFGFLPLALFTYVETQTSADLDHDYSPVLFLVGIVAISWAVVSVTVAAVGVGAVALLICAVYARRLLYSSPDRLLGRLWRAPPGYLELAGIGTLLFLSYPSVAFPADPHGAGTIVNLYTHLLGYALGFMSTYALRLRGGFHFE